MANPFSLNFGKEPYRVVSRQNQIQEITDTFVSDTPSTMVYVITGVRGSGKTVTMMSAFNELKKSRKWIALTLNPNRDLLSELAAGLFDNPLIKPAFVKAEISLNFVVSASLTIDSQVTDVDVQLKKMFRIIDSMGIKVLVAIDEVSKSEQLKIFASTYQMLISEGFPFYLLMTGLYENIRNLQNEKNLTFLYRAPQIELKPLGIMAMSNNYKEVFDISDDEALEMARFTRGYSYAFQVLGYLKYKRNNAPLEEITPEFDEIMEEYSYEKIWSELSERDREVIKLLAKNGRMKVKDIQTATGMTSGSFSTYRRRLGKGGLISLEDYGYCELSLPRFGEIVNAWSREE